MYVRLQGRPREPRMAATGMQARRRNRSMHARRASMGIGMGSVRVERTLRDSHAAKAAL